VPLDGIPYIDFPELKLDEHESTGMPFRYVKGKDGGPVMPEVCLRRGDLANECRD
jgi:ribosome biogenesis SPOUT family RNA methylase Rps3